MVRKFHWLLLFYSKLLLFDTLKITTTTFEKVTLYVFSLNDLVVHTEICHTETVRVPLWAKSSWSADCCWCFWATVWRCCAECVQTQIHGCECAKSPCL